LKFVVESLAFIFIVNAIVIVQISV
jgi:hypothetical protein